MINWFKSCFPNAKAIKNGQKLGGVKGFFSDPCLWCINCESVSRAVAIGFFVAVIPIMPFQMLLGAVLAVFFRANLPIMLAASWINNPLTIVPITYYTYYLGMYVIGDSNEEIRFTDYDWKYNWNNYSLMDHWHEAATWFFNFGKAFLVGLPIVALSFAVFGYVLVRILWSVRAYIRR